MKGFKTIINQVPQQLSEISGGDEKSLSSTQAALIRPPQPYCSWLVSYY